MKKPIKGWALKNDNNRFVWKNKVLFSDPIKTVLFRTRAQAVQYMKNINAPWGEMRPVRVEIFIKETHDDDITALD